MLAKRSGSCIHRKSAYFGSALLLLVFVVLTLCDSAFNSLSIIIQIKALSCATCTVCRCRRVGYLECDVGQTEFTVAAVTALHVLTEPVFGPAHTHPRKAYK